MGFHVFSPLSAAFYIIMVKECAPPIMSVHVDRPITPAASAVQSAKEMQRMRRQRSCQLWKSVLTVSLLEGTGLPAMDDNGEWAGTHSHCGYVCDVTVQPVQSSYQ